MNNNQCPTKFDGMKAATVWLSLLVSLVGCSNGDQPELGTVTGKVTLEGEPLTNVEIQFVPTVGRPSYGETDGEGNYDLVYIREIHGAKVGSHKVLIRSGKVDEAKLDPVDVVAGKNVIDIDCHRRAKPPVKSKSDDEDV